jgi:hypothetical protein
MDVHEHGADTHTRAIHPHVTTLAEKLKSNGYRTVQVTANQVTTGVFGLDRGFDEVYKVWQMVTPRFNKIVRWGLSMTKPRMRKLFFSKDILSKQLLSDLSGANCWGQNTHRDAFNKVRSLMKEADDKNEKCFFFINLMETHFPYHVDDIFHFVSDNFFDKIREGWSLFNVINQSFLHTDAEIIKPKFRELIRQRQVKSWQIIKNDLDDFVEEIHSNQNNLVAFCSDHGDNFGEMGWYYHFANVNEAGNRVPLFYLENGVKTQKIIDTPISSKFVHHTIMEKVGSDEPVTLFKNPSRNFPIIESIWYAHNRGTMEKYKYNQMLFAEKDTRYVWRNDEWLSAPVSQNEYHNEENYTALPAGANPIMDVIDDPEKKIFLQEKLKNWKPFSDKMLKY